MSAAAVAFRGVPEAPSRRLTVISTAPDLETERLILRPPQVSDLADSTTLWGDAEVVRHIGGRIFSPEEVWARVLRYIGHWAAMGYGYWTVRERATGRFVGEVGLADHHRDIQPPLGDDPEAGWVLATASHGRGFATEAMRAVLAWSDRTLAAPRTVCLIDEANAASVRVAEKLGYRERVRTTYKGDPAIVMERPRQ
jgi:RimJ/RimL family protein N-acetyltransferase